jgi:hypothetical protein
MRETDPVFGTQKPGVSTPSSIAIVLELVLVLDFYH